MCGICGIVNASDDVDRLRTMLDRMAHRGPDDEGDRVRPGAALGMKRLSILDLLHGRQPMTTPDGRVTAVVNGEIYNWGDLARWLEARGRRLRTRCDAEVVPHLYAELGEAFVHRLRGMFAVAVWDERERKLVLVRDRLGEKPLYYHVAGGRLVFASEMKCLLGEVLKQPEVDPVALDLYLALLYVPAPRTILRGVRKLMPGEMLVWQDGRTTTRTWWDPAPSAAHRRRERDVIEATRAALHDAIRRTLQADVPVGAFLSGGLDSTLVAGMMTRESAEPVRAYTIGYPGASDYDETPFAREAAEHFGLIWRRIEFSPADLWRDLPAAVWHLDEPVANVSSVMNLRLAREAAREVKVALTGTGGDEAFLGYPRYLGLRAAPYWRKVPRAWRDVACRLAAGLPETTRGGARTLIRAKKFLQGEFTSPLAAIVAWRSYLAPLQRRGLLAPPWRLPEGNDPVAEVFASHLGPWRGASWVEQLAHLDLKTYLPGYLLEHNDKVSMAASLELRSPLLDYRLVELAQQASPGLRLKRWTTKYVLKRAAEGIVPKRLIWRKKVGFNNPAALWFKGPLREALRRVLAPENVLRTGVFAPEAVRRLVEEHVAGRANHEYRLWAILNFELWHRTYLQHRSFDAPVPMEDLARARPRHAALVA